MLQTKVLQVLGNITALNEVLRTFSRYACRLCGSSGVGALYHLELAPSEREGLRSLKEWIDHATYRNTLYHALWWLSKHQRPPYKCTAAKHGLDPDELRYLFQLLVPQDRAAIATAPEPTTFSAVQVAEVLRAVQGSARNLVKYRLRYCYANDAGVSAEDFFCELQCQAIKVIRNYEVLGLTTQEMVPLVARGLTNHTKNLASYYGKSCRSPLQRVEQRSDYREVWYCNVNSDRVEKARVSTTPAQRRGEYCLAEFDHRPGAYIYMRRLYDTRKEAETALEAEVRGRGTCRTVVVDLSNTKQDDWQPTKTSLDTPNQENATPLIDFLPMAGPFVEKEIELESDDPRARLFFCVVSGDLGPMFESYCEDTTGHTSAELTEWALGRAARRYCGISMKELVAAVSLM